MKFTTRAERAERSRISKEKQAKELELFKNGFKYCNKCNKVLPISEFWKNKAGRFGLESSCKICKELSKGRSSTLIAEEYLRKCTKCGIEAKCPEHLELFVKAGDRERSLHGRRNLCKECHNKSRNKAKHNLTRKCKTKGITVEIYNSMLKSQDNCCKICNINFSDLPNKSLHIDHCHSTGKVRGLLCSHCNTAIGLLKDDIGIMKKAIEYIKRNYH